MDIRELRALPLFDGLDDAQLEELLAAATEKMVERGDVLFEEQRPADNWWVLLEGSIALVRQVGTEQSVFGHMTSPGQWAGGFAAWDEFGVYFATGRAESPGRVLRVESAQLRRLVEQWFPFRLHFIHGLVNTVRRIESTARQREALVALGTLSAGLAHELNNPASAATRAADTLQSTSTALLVALSHLAATGISPEQFTVLNDLRLRVSDSGDEPAPTAIALADREDELSEWLVDHEVDRDWEIAPALAAAGADAEWCEEVARGLPGAALGPAM